MTASSDTRGSQRLSLYTRGRCFFCVYVMRAIKQLGLDVELRDIGCDPRHRSDLIAATGRKTVPVLHIEHDDGRIEWLPESRHIVRYLYRCFAD